MKLILLSGRSNSGKTTTLKKLYKNLTNDGKKNVLSIYDKNDEFDNEYIIMYKNKKVAIVTGCDILWKYVEKIIKYANQDILVMAYNNKFAFGLDQMTSNCEYHSVVKKLRPNDSDCERVCNKIIEQLG